MVLYTIQSPLFFRKIVENERYSRPFWPVLAWTMLNGRGGFGNPKARSLGAFESSYKIAASEGERSIWTILRKKEDCEQSINVITDRN